MSTCRVCGKTEADQLNPQGRVTGPPEGWSSVTFSYPLPIENVTLCAKDAIAVRLLSLPPISVVNISDVARQAIL